MAACLRHVNLASNLTKTSCNVHRHLFNRGLNLTSTSVLRPASLRAAHSLHHTKRNGVHLLAQAQTNAESQLWKHISVSSVRWSSTGPTITVNQPTTASSQFPEGYIPEAPPIPVPEVPEVVLNALGEPTLQSLGLGGFWPSGIYQQVLELLHVSTGLPWFGAIIASTICLRLLMFPVIIWGQRNSVKMANHMPVVTRLQERFSEARMSGNQLEAARAGAAVAEYMSKNNVSPYRAMMLPLAQVPVFLSVFFGLRQMANFPLEGFKTGGALWFVDLTLTDPFYLLPLITSATLLATIELGVDGMSTSAMGHTGKWVMRGMPFVMFPFIMNFPAALLCYWCTSNIFSLLQVKFLKIPEVRSFFKIPVAIKHDPSLLRKKGFTEGFRDTWKNSKLLAEVESRQRSDSVKFKEAGLGPIVKTYPYNPKAVKPEAETKKLKMKKSN